MVEDPIGFHPELSFLSRTLRLHRIGGFSRPPAPLMIMIWPSLNFLSLCTSLKVEEVAPVLIRTIGLVGDMTIAGFFTMAFKCHLMKSS